MIVRSAKVGAVLLGACLLLASAARAEEPKDKSLSEQAREQGRERLRELREVERSARGRLRQAEQKVREANQQAKSAAADAKQAAEAALSEAKQAAERAQLEASTAGTNVLQAIRDINDAGKRTLETAHTEAHAATDRAVGKAVELKSGVAKAAAKARNEAEGAAQDVAAEASTAVRNIEAKAHQIMQTAVGATGENARRRHARRMAWRELSKHVERPRDVPPSVREELRRHAQRMARLKRVRMLANDKKEPALVERADALITREEQRHAKKLAILWSATHAQRGTDRAKTGEDEDQEPAEEQAEEEEEQQ